MKLILGALLVIVSLQPALASSRDITLYGHADYGTFEGEPFRCAGHSIIGTYHEFPMLKFYYAPGGNVWGPIELDHQITNDGEKFLFKVSFSLTPWPAPVSRGVPCEVVIRVMEH